MLTVSALQLADHLWDGQFAGQLVVTGLAPLGPLGERLQPAEPTEPAEPAEPTDVVSLARR